MIRRGFKYFILVCLCLLGFSCTLQNRYGEIALALPENGLSSGRTAARGVGELPLGDTYPDIYTIKVTPNSGDRILVEGKAGQNIVIANLMPGDYEVIVEGEKSGFLFHGKTNVVVESGKTTEARLELYKSEIKGEGGVPGVTIDEAIAKLNKTSDNLLKLKISDTYDENKLKQLAKEIIKKETTSVELDLSEYREMKEVPLELFYDPFGCKSLESIVLPTSATIIQDSAFRGCENLKKINLENVVTINTEGFYDCTLLTNITLGNSLDFIGVQTFRNCTAIETVTIPASVRRIMHKAFEGCENLASVTFIDKSITWGLYDDFGKDTYTVGTSEANAEALKTTYLNKDWKHPKYFAP